MVARMKGAAVQDFFRWYEREYGAAHNDRVWSRLPQRHRDALGSSHEQLMAFHWYPVESIHALIDSALDGMGDAERERVIGNTLRGLYKAIFVTLVSPRRYLKSVNIVWRAFHDTGRIDGVELGPMHHRTELTGWEGYHPFIERLNGHAATEVYDALGCKDVRVEQLHELQRGSPKYVTEIRWSS